MSAPDPATRPAARSDTRPAAEADASDHPRPGRPIGYWLKLVDRLIDDSVDDVFHRTGLTRRHWQVLNMVRDGVGDVTVVDGVLSPSGAGGTAPGHAAGVSAEVEDLVRRGWVARSATGLTVTVSGNHAYHDLLDAVAGARERLAEGITAEQYDQMIATLERMALNLGWSTGS